jgi:hypothetical protein
VADALRSREGAYPSKSHTPTHFPFHFPTPLHSHNLLRVKRPFVTSVLFAVSVRVR